MNIKTTINVLLRVVFMTTMTFVMSIQTAGAQTMVTGVRHRVTYIGCEKFPQQDKHHVALGGVL